MDPRLRFSALLTVSLVISGSARAADVRKESIFDPGMRMNAYDAYVPTNWKFDGAFFPGSTCSNVPFPVFRTYSPDGLTEVRRYPRLDWTWSNSTIPGANHPDCLNFKQEMPAHDFLIYIMGVLQIAYVRDAPVPRILIDNAQRSDAALNANAEGMGRMMKTAPIVQKTDFASGLGQYRNGSFTVEAEVRVQIHCIHTPLASFTQRNLSTDSCSATVRVARAPKGQLAAFLAGPDANVGATENVQWAQAYIQAMQARASANIRAAMDQAQALRNRQHQQFMDTMAEGTRRSLERTAAAAEARHQIASDWCDYALDRQTVVGAGGTVKISNAYTHTWSDGLGDYYQTNNPNADPNGVFKGNWTQQQRVHGDGTPY